MTALTDAWQAALRAEQQAAFGYALLGPRLPSAQQALARTCQASHESVRDRTADAIAATGATPAAPAGDYPALYPRASVPRALAAQLEDDCAAAWRYLYAQAAAGTGSDVIRKQAQAELIASAVRATQWRKHANPKQAVQAFPGHVARTARSRCRTADAHRRERRDRAGWRGRGRRNAPDARATSWASRVPPRLIAPRAATSRSTSAGPSVRSQLAPSGPPCSW